LAAYIIKVPDIGEGIAEVELVQWHVKPGDMVAEEQPLADVMTDKANVEIPSHVAGKVVSVSGKPGDVIAVGSELIRLEVEGKGNVQGEPEPKPEAKAERKPDPKPEQQPEPKPEPKPPPILRAVPQAATAPEAAPAKRPERPLASPAVRRRARELLLELDDIQGTGPEGRVTQEDLEAYLQRTRRGASLSAPLRYNIGPGGRFAPGMQRASEETVQVIGLRRKIAEKMQEAKRRIPHFAYVEEVDVTALEDLRVELNKRYRTERGHLTLLPFLMRAIVQTAPEFSEVNARYDDDAGMLTKYGAVHIGIATQTPGGLMVPVVRNAEARDLWGCAAEVARLAEGARTGKATREELTGSTITITSLGPLGGIVTTPVINHPEVAIVGVNKVVERPVVRDGAIVIRKIMNLSSSFDHRIVDGLRAAMFVQGLRACLESPATMFIE
jgi:2-oxoisovalerate dehydrogenase E2 component (dihydrolipoyl transacylase)